MMALVRGVICLSMSSGEMFKSRGPVMSAKRTPAFAYSTAFAVATNVSEGTITSSPGPIPSARHARWSASVALETASACRAPVNRANAASNSWVTAPIVSQRRRITSSTAACSSGP